MRFNKFRVLVVSLAACASAWAQTAKYDNVGRTATPEEIRAHDITVLPSGKGLPPGKGTAKEGAPIYLAHCVMCHGATGKEGGPLAPKLVGDTTYERGPMTSWPFATSVWDYINRAMPRYREGALTPDQSLCRDCFPAFSKRHHQGNGCHGRQESSRSANAESRWVGSLASGGYFEFKKAWGP